MIYMDLYVLPLFMIYMDLYDFLPLFMIYMDLYDLLPLFMIYMDLYDLPLFYDLHGFICLTAVLWFTWIYMS